MKQLLLLIFFVLYTSCQSVKTDIHAFDYYIGQWSTYEIKDDGTEILTPELWEGYYKGGKFIVKAQSPPGIFLWTYSYDEELDKFSATCDQGQVKVNMLGTYDEATKKFTFKGEYSTGYQLTAVYWRSDSKSFSHVTISKDEKVLAVVKKRNQRKE
jgi:hypothetical protein